MGGLTWKGKFTYSRLPSGTDVWLQEIHHQGANRLEFVLLKLIYLAMLPNTAHSQVRQPKFWILLPNTHHIIAALWRTRPVSASGMLVSLIMSTINPKAP